MEQEKIINIEELVQDEHNFNKGTDEGGRLMERSFKEMGAGRSVLIDKHGKIIAGNKSQKAAIAAGIKRVRVIETTGDELIAVKRTDVELESEQGRKMALLDNLTTQVNLAWDETELQTITGEIEGFDVGDFGFDIKDMPQTEFATGTATREVNEQKETEEDDFDPDAQYETKVHEGDIWALGAHKLLCGDSTKAENVSRLLGEEKADMVFTDPPYLMGFQGNVHADGSKSFNAQFGEIKNDKMSREDGDTFIFNVFDMIRQFCKGAYYVCFYRLGLDYIFRALDAHNNRYRALIIWDKGNHTLSNSDYMSKYEPIVYGWFDEHNFYGDRSNFDIWPIQRTQKNELHPTMKPIALCAKAIQNSSKEGDIVLDLFGGSGSTMIACEQVGRKARLIELDTHYCNVIIARWEKLTGQKAVKLEGV